MEFKCGCKIELPIDWSNIPLDCPYTWDIFCEGNTKGVFQLETGLGKSWSKKTQPRRMYDLAALISVIRPGVLESRLDGKSLTQHYADRKLGKEKVEYIHPALEKYLGSTYGILTFQEQILNIAKGLAGYSLGEADKLRKAIGKKIAKDVFAHREKFINGAEKVGIISKDIAEEVFDWIEKSARYSFNASHAVAYATIGYRTAYAKAHFPIEFMVSCFRSAKDKVKPKQEIAELVIDCKNNGINVSPPQFYDISRDKLDFYHSDNEIFFSLTNIKGCGKAQILKIIEKIELKEQENDKIDIWDWNSILYNLGDESKTVMENSISCGAFDYLGLDRQKMLYELHLYRDLRPIEKKWIQTVDGDLKTRLQKSIKAFNEYSELTPKEKKNAIEKKSLSDKRRFNKVKQILDLLENPPIELVDSELVNSSKEKELLGVSLTVDILHKYNTSVGTCTCMEFNSGFDEDRIVICGKINRVSPYIIKTGKNAGNEMCFITIEDSTGELNCVLFTQQYLLLKEDIYPGNVLGFVGKRSDYKDSLVINDIIEI